MRQTTEERAREFLETIEKLETLFDIAAEQARRVWVDIRRRLESDSLLDSGTVGTLLGRGDRKLGP